MVVAISHLTCNKAVSPSVDRGISVGSVGRREGRSVARLEFKEGWWLAGDNDYW